MDADLFARARRQHGLVAHRQALEHVSLARVKRLLADRRLEPLRRGVYRAAGAPESWAQHLMAACLACDGAVASFRAAAALWMLPGFDPDVLEITIEGTRRVRLSGVVVHESQVWGPGHVAARMGIPCTSVARTLCDLTALARPWMVGRAVDDALRRKLVSLPDLRRVADALDGKGRRRCTTMREILAERLPGYDPGGSEAERRLARALIRAGLPPPVAQHRINTGVRIARVDFAYPEHGVVIEYDGWDHHRGRSSFDGDRARGNELELLGLIVLRFTSAARDATIVAQVRAALEQRGWQAA